MTAQSTRPTAAAMPLLRTSWSGWLRLATLVLSGMGLFLPGFYIISNRLDLSDTVLKAVPLAWVPFRHWWPSR